MSDTNFSRNLGISFNKHYFDTRIATILSQVIKDALHYNQLLIELRKRIRNSERIASSELVDELRDFLPTTKQLKHDRKQLQKSLEVLKEDANNIRVSLHAAQNTVNLLKEENDNLSEQLHRALRDREQLEVMLMCKNTELLSVYASNQSKDHRLQQLLKEVNSANDQLESLIGMVEVLEKQILSIEQLDGNAEVLNQVDALLTGFEGMISILSENN